jgi:hypothetical protein
VKTNLDYIAAMWLEGLTTAVIGERLGIPKNSVCRLVFDARKGGDMRFPARAFAVPKKPKPKLIMRPPMPRRKLPPPPPKPRVMPPLITELNPRECRYPVTPHDIARDAHRFCAKSQTAGSAYCAEHHALCNPPPKPRVHR